MRAVRMIGVAAFSIALTSPAFAGVIKLTSRPATGDLINWVQIDSSGNANPFATPANFTSTSGITGSATLVKDGTSCLQIFVSCPGDGEIYVEGGNFLGNFGHGDSVFYTHHSGPLTLSFNTPLSTVGAQIDYNTYGAFTAEIQVFNQNTLLGTFTEDGTVTTNDDNSAIFLGATDTDGGITSIVYSVTWNQEQRDLADFAINQVSIAAAPPPVSVPEPATLALFSAGVLGVGAVRRRRKAKA